MTPDIVVLLAFLTFIIIFRKIIYQRIIQSLNSYIKSITDPINMRQEEIIDLKNQLMALQQNSFVNAKVIEIQEKSMKDIESLKIKYSLKAEKLSYDYNEKLITIKKFLEQSNNSKDPIDIIKMTNTKDLMIDSVMITFAKCYKTRDNESIDA